MTTGAERKKSQRMREHDRQLIAKAKFWASRPPFDTALHEVTVRLPSIYKAALDAFIARDQGNGRPLDVELVILLALREYLPGLRPPQGEAVAVVRTAGARRLG